MVLARLLRLVLVLAVVGLVLVLFFYAFLVALVVAPILALLFFFFGRKVGKVWVVGDLGPSPGAPGSHHSPPVIDHDPDALGPKVPPENKP